MIGGSKMNKYNLMLELQLYKEYINPQCNINALTVNEVLDFFNCFLSVNNLTTGTSTVPCQGLIWVTGGTYSKLQ